jgi:hypothetical protein
VNSKAAIVRRIQTACSNQIGQKSDFALATRASDILKEEELAERSRFHMGRIRKI